MQPKDVPSHIRIKYKPSYLQKGRSCRLYGKNFKSIADAARENCISYSWAKEQVNNGWNLHHRPRKERKKF
jgi:hypothetical protein